MKRVLIILILIQFCGGVFAQSNEILDELYKNDDAKTNYVSLIVLQAAGILDDQATVDDATTYLESYKWGETVLNDGEFITTGSFSLLVMEAFNLPHGLIYNIFPNRRYALKEMVYREFILGSPYPNDIISSFNVVYALSSLPVNESINKDYIDTSDQVSDVLKDVKEAPTTVTNDDVIDDVLDDTALPIKEDVTVDVVDDTALPIKEDVTVDVVDDATEPIKEDVTVDVEVDKTPIDGDVISDSVVASPGDKISEP
ncbi:hypothetical protein EW093_07090 [Thiospirochaeta perfilievii]|uniref:Uncharacterized protein n=1 Tax=Thiospirochaeta perfilievii TaxID=252967 RepID=A0A5C1Q8Q4_9SPIO|nr:hypothetical protein [Thiospirochaeta perfilievii]QEN04473.1 hypothetical protein EW093_07090 [Thiospirochaeta perfilievii]